MERSNHRSVGLVHNSPDMAEPQTKLLILDASDIDASSEDEDFNPPSQSVDCNSEDESLVYEMESILSHIETNVNENVQVASDYEDSKDDGFDTPYNSDENDLGEYMRKKRRRFVVSNLGCDHAKFNFVIGMIFETRTQFRECVQKYGIANEYNIGWKRTYELRMEVKCFGNCKWIYAMKK
ncbi:hypothetical protein GH714_037013 [Hevea brasiliensis]|uniref:Transposase MuDR plant domain-containing protein n=1 Tax=Hevea brasiliensis TaxID=3981 RepID=A0A6A6M7I0_HEVBR|nr:hypothetical protein GH714_037013 [Hevea brasiliensis]